MKKLHYILLPFVVLFALQACSLDETNLSSATEKNYFKYESSFNQLVTEAYIYTRPLLQNTESMWYGTDIIERIGELNDARLPLDDYSKMNTDECESWWRDNYYLISKVNTAFNRGAQVPNIANDLRAKREAELYVLRAYAYFNLVETFGGVPLQLEELIAPKYDFVRASEEDVYTQIVKDLEVALTPNSLPEKPEATGRIAAGAANHLMAKVLLTRSYKSFAKSTDLTRAIECAQKAISIHPMVTNWKELFGEKDYKNGNSEIMFAVQYSTNNAWNNNWGNNLYQQFKFITDLFPGGERGAPYYRQDDRFQPTLFFLNLFDNNDTRVSDTYLKRTIVAAKEVKDANNTVVIAKGAPVIYFPKVAMTDTEIAAYKVANPTIQYVINPEDYHKIITNGRTAFPIVWKFNDPNVKKYTNHNSNPEGTRDTYVFRSAETKLLLAEAYVKRDGGTSADATTLINDIRSRSGADVLTTPATIDDVLDESARELFGESNRWIDLKRSGKLLERAQKYNVFVKRSNPTAVPAFNALRPIPQQEITYSQGTLTQNPGYNGAK